MSKEIKVDKNSYRVHDDLNKEIIRKSLKEYGAGRSILLDKNGVIIAGNATYEQAKELGMPVKIVEVDGKTLVGLKRIDLKRDDAKREGLGIVDNSSSDLSRFDVAGLLNQYSMGEIQEYGIPVFEPTTIDPDEFFEGGVVKEKKKKKVLCNHCGKEFEI